MRGKVAKRLRKQSMGEGYSVRARIYGELESNGSRICLGARASYKKAKDEYKKGKC